eukprot:679112-Prymnesium_polylepis.2
MRARLMGHARLGRGTLGVHRAGIPPAHCTVRSGLIHGAENAPFLQRRDARMLGAGRSSAAHSRSEGPSIPVRVKVEQKAALA